MQFETTGRIPWWLQLLSAGSDDSDDNRMPTFVVWLAGSIGNGTTRCICGPSNTYIALYVFGDPQLPGRWKYAVFQTHCTSEQVTTAKCFDKPDTIELFDLEADPWELANVAHEHNYTRVQRELDLRVRRWYGCKGTGCH